MTDRELLELAAKAAGYVFNHELMACTHVGVHGGWWKWQPLDDDGDAFRLAVKLGLIVDAGAHRASDGSANWFGQVGERDPYTATRRAIVRAAASIARSKGDAGEQT